MPVLRDGRLAPVMLVAVMLCVTGSSSSHAAITQQIFFEFDPAPGTNGDEDVDSEQIRGQNEAEIDRSITASIGGTGYSASGSVGEFGTYGLQGNVGRVGRLHAQVFIEADVQAPPIGGQPREAVANFIVDGGAFTMIAGQGSRIDFALNLSTNKSISPIFQSRFEFVADSSGANPVLTTFGPDLGIEQSGTSLDIPFSFQSASLGVLNPGEVVNFEYQLDIITDIVSFSEITLLEFQDPLTIQPPQITADLARPSISFVTAIPEPSSAVLLAVACGTLGLVRRRHRCKRS